MAFRSKDCLQCRRPGFHLWVRKMPWRKEWQPTPVFFPENPRQRGAGSATAHGVTRSQTRLSHSLHSTVALTQYFFNHSICYCIILILSLNLCFIFQFWVCSEVSPLGELSLIIIALSCQVHQNLGNAFHTMPCPAQEVRVNPVRTSVPIFLTSGPFFVVNIPSPGGQSDVAPRSPAPESLIHLSPFRRFWQGSATSGLSH